MQAEDRETWEERAAIMEFDAGMPRAQAERMARRELPYIPCANLEIPPDRLTPGYLAYREFRQRMKQP